MRLIIHDYEDGTRHIYETTDDGSKIIRHVEGQPQPGKRIRAFVEVTCDNNEIGKETAVNDLQEAVSFVQSKAI